MMKNILLLFILLQGSLGGFSLMAASVNPVAYQDEQVRFCVLTDGVVRMEWSPTGQFVNEPSFVAVERKLKVPAYQVEEEGEWLVLTTAKMTLKYKKNSGKFTADNLEIKAVLGEQSFTWRPGMKQTNNLKGTSRTLDGYDGDLCVFNNQRMQLEDGLLSSDGWTLIDDSGDFLFDNSEWAWVKPRTEKDAQDWYFMSYGQDYKGALKDFTAFAGKVPLPPRYAFGYWWSRYWSYSDKEVRQLVDNFDRYHIPLDVLVVDMDWHYTEPGLGGWTGWTWNRRLFPDPGEFLGYLKDHHLKITLNLHPADGVASYEEKYPQMAEWMGMDPKKKETIPWTVSDKRFMNGMFDVVLKPMEKQGVDFWWLDWQQWLTDRKVEGLSNTWWINYVFFSHMERSRNTRPLLYHRWGGLGNHRYQIGFSGDAIITWESLAYQPYFTSCASNVLYGYWSHDIGGHMFKGGQKEELEPELFTRWMQYGVFSPIFRTHSGKFASVNKELWNFKGEYFEAQQNAVNFRYTLAPYIYTMARETYDLGLSLCRPMYYDYPDKKEAYDFQSEYMFGDQLLVAPIGTPMVDGRTTVKVWLPEGNDWFEWNTGTLLKGGQVLERSFALTEYPIYVKAGAVLPLYDRVKNLTANNEEIIVAVFPGKQGNFNMYEDNGNDKYYDKEYATTQLTSVKNGQELTVTIGSRKGKYKDMPKHRQFKVKVYGSAIPQTVTMNGKTVAYEYLGEELALWIEIPETSCAKSKTIKITYPADTPELNDGMVSQFKHLSRAVTDLKYRDAYIVLNQALGTLESTSVALSYYPERFNELIRQFRQNYARLPQILKEQNLNDENQQWFLNTIHWKVKN